MTIKNSPKIECCINLNCTPSPSTSNVLSNVHNEQYMAPYVLQTNHKTKVTLPINSLHVYFFWVLVLTTFHQVLHKSYSQLIRSILVLLIYQIF